jgi:hypothetical protein
MVNITVKSKEVRITPFGYKEVEVSLDNVDEDELLNHLTIKDVVSHFDTDDILDEIGIDKVMEYFNLKEIDE